MNRHIDTHLYFKVRSNHDDVNVYEDFPKNSYGVLKSALSKKYKHHQYTYSSCTFRSMEKIIRDNNVKIIKKNMIDVVESDNALIEIYDNNYVSVSEFPNLEKYISSKNYKVCSYILCIVNNITTHIDVTLDDNDNYYSVVIKSHGGVYDEQKTVINEAKDYIISTIQEFHKNTK